MRGALFQGLDLGDLSIRSHPAGGWRRRLLLGEDVVLVFSCDVFCGPDPLGRGRFLFGRDVTILVLTYVQIRKKCNFVCTTILVYDSAFRRYC